MQIRWDKKNQKRIRYNQKTYIPKQLKMRFQREIKGLEARQRLEALVIPKRQALTRLQGLLATLRHRAEMAFLQQH
jgi:plasmid maintenance system killer protein